MLIGLAAICPTADLGAPEEGPIKSWQVALPGMAFAAATASAFVLAAMGKPLGTNLTVLASSLGLLLVVSNLLSLADAAQLRHANRLAEEMLRRIDLPFPSSPIAAFSVDSQGQLVFSQGPVLDRMQRSDEKGMASHVTLPKQTREAVQITELELEIDRLRQTNEVLKKIAGFAAADA